MSPSKLRAASRGREARLNAGLMRRECSKMGWGKNSSSLHIIHANNLSPLKITVIPMEYHVRVLLKHIKVCNEKENFIIPPKNLSESISIFRNLTY